MHDFDFKNMHDSWHSQRSNYNQKSCFALILVHGLDFNPYSLIWAIDEHENTVMSVIILKNAILKKNESGQIITQINIQEMLAGIILCHCPLNRSSFFNNPKII